MARALGDSKYLDATVNEGDDYVYVCQRPGCTRFFVPWLPEVYSFEEQARWLIAEDRFREGAPLVVRCPQHISNKAMKYTIGLTPEKRVWRDRMAEEDWPIHQAWSPLTPFPMEPGLLWTEDGHISVPRRGRNGKKRRTI